ncbi:MAG: iron-sulfur cluster co-chaperone HscB C-terminal domain-containing protein [Phycisphaerales bacterium]
MSDPFAILGLPPRFEVTPAEVERAYLSRVSGLHPDTAGAGEDASAALNDAKETLLNSEVRARALLALLEGPGASQDRSLPEGFLAGMMEVREEMASAVDASSRAQWRAWAVQRRGEYEREVGALFAAAAGGAAVLTRVRRTLNAWRYIERMIEQIDGVAQA